MPHASQYDLTGGAFSSLGNTSPSKELSFPVTHRSVSHEPECANSDTSDPTGAHKSRALSPHTTPPSVDMVCEVGGRKRERAREGEGEGEGIMVFSNV